jgi:putative ABC transport system permease protein
VRVQLMRADSEEPTISVPALAAGLAELDDVFVSLGQLRYSVGHVTGSGEAQYSALQLTSLNFFDTLAVQAQMGRTFTARGPAPDGRDVVVLRRRYWLDEFGGEPLVGRTISINGEPKTVLGIIADDQTLPSWADMWSPELRLSGPGPDFGDWIHWLGRLAPGVSLEQASGCARSRK